ncbi:unnamed protein product [Symbiodinium sp. CCMP2456]|nr:unnamed protein product [Symbiodinium sp. CCMP2456]
MAMSPTLERRLSRSTQGTSSSVALRWSAGDSMSSTPASLPPSLTQSAQSWRVLAPGASAVPRLEVAQERAPRTSRLQPLPSLPDEAIEAKALQPPAPVPNTARGGCGQTRLSPRQDGASLQRSGSEMLRAPTLRLSLRNSQKALQQTLLEIRQLNQQKRHVQKELEHRQLSTTSPLRQQANALVTAVADVPSHSNYLDEPVSWLAPPLAVVYPDLEPQSVPFRNSLSRSKLHGAWLACGSCQSFMKAEVDMKIWTIFALCLTLS